MFSGQLRLRSTLSTSSLSSKLSCSEAHWPWRKHLAHTASHWRSVVSPPHAHQRQWHATPTSFPGLLCPRTGAAPSPRGPGGWTPPHAPGRPQHQSWCYPGNKHTDDASMATYTHTQRSDCHWGILVSLACMCVNTVCILMFVLCSVFDWLQCLRNVCFLVIFLLKVVKNEADKLLNSFFASGETDFLFLFVSFYKYFLLLQGLLITNFVRCNSKLLHCKLWILLCFLPKHNWVESGPLVYLGLTKNKWQSMCFNPNDLTSFSSLIWLRHLGKWLVHPGFHQIWLLTRCRHRKMASAFWLPSHKTPHPV